jgi:hypothetical protein
VTVPATSDRNFTPTSIAFESALFAVAGTADVVQIEICCPKAGIVRHAADAISPSQPAILLITKLHRKLLREFSPETCKSPPRNVLIMEISL